MNFKRLTLTLISAFTITVSYSQKFLYPSIKAKGNNIKEFIPAKWTVIDSAFGDLNKDGIKDAALILQHKDSVLMLNDLEEKVMTQPRILLILLKNNSANAYELAAQSNSFILKHDNPAMEDPYQGLAINNGVLEITLQLFYNMGSWYVTNATYRFRYQQKQFVLIGADNSSFHRATQDFEEYSYNFLTKKRALTKGNDNKGTKKTAWKAINVSPLKTLKTFNQPFTWEVEKDIFL